MPSSWHEPLFFHLPRAGCMTSVPPNVKWVSDYPAGLVSSEQRGSPGALRQGTGQGPVGLAPHLPTAQCRGHCYLFGIKIWLYQDLSPSPGQPEQHQDLAQQDTPHRHAVLHPTPNLSLGCRLYSTAQLGLGWSSRQPKARGPGNSGPFVHCLTQSLEIPHQPQGSFPGGLQRGGLTPLTSPNLV